MTQSTAAMMKQKTNNPLPMLTFEHTRDAYGFAVRPQHLQRYREYASIYTEEEDERFVKWKCFLKKLAESAQPTTVEYGSSDRMCIGGLEKGVEEEDSSDKKSIDSLAKERPTKNEIKTSNSQRWTQIRPPLAVIKHMMTICDSKKILSKQEQTLKEELEVLVHGGVPMALRGEVWKAFLGVLSRQDQEYYEGLQSAAEKWKDLPRTFPGHPALDEDGRNALRRLLTAYARHNPSVGDCQAMNFFAGLLVLLMPEENAFWALLGIMDEYLEGYFSEEMIESQVDQLVLEELVRERFPELVNHLDYLGVEVTWVTGPWFIFLFVNVLPWESVLRIWDVLLFEGNRVMLFRISLALMDLYGPDLVTTKNIGDAITLLQSLTGSTFNSSQLVLTACTCYNEVNEAQLQELRDKYRPSVMAAVEEKSQVIDAYDSQGLDLQEQVVWLKRQLSKLIEEKQCAIIRAEELEITVKEMVLEDNAAKCKIDCLEKIIIEAEKTMEKEREQLEWELGKKYPSRKSEVSVNDNFIGGLASILQTELFEKYMSSYQREVDDEQVDLNSFSEIIKWDRRYPQHSLTSRYTNLEASSHMDVLGCKVDKSSIMVFPCASSVKRNKIILIASVACGFHYQIRDLG